MKWQRLDHQYLSMFAAKKIDTDEGDSYHV